MLEKLIEKAIKDILLGNNKQENGEINYFNNNLIGQKCIIRTYSAGVWFGELVKKEENEVYLKQARRINFFKVLSGISLSSVANNGLHSDSKVAEPVDIIWLEAIEIIPCKEIAVQNIETIKTHEG